MNDNNFTDIIQQGLRIAIGATTSAVETLQNPEKINSKLNELNAEWQQKSTIWAEKGAVTEEEAKRMIEKFFQQEKNQNNSTTSSSSSVNSRSNSTQEIRKLTQEIIILKDELEKANSDK